MVSGFVAVPFFKFVGPELTAVGPALEALSELPPSFLVSFALGVLVSRLDPQGQERLRDVAAELEAAGSDE